MARTSVYSIMKSMRRGLTLVELMVIIVVIAVLAAVLFPVFAQKNTSQKRAATLSSLKQIGASVSMYRGEYDNTYPPLSTFNPLDQSLEGSLGYAFYPQLLAPYIQDENAFHSSADQFNDRALTDPQGRARLDPKNEYHDYFAGSNPSYGYNYRYLNRQNLDGYLEGEPLSRFGGVPSSEIENPAKTIVFAEATMKNLEAHMLGQKGMVVRNPVGYSRIEPPFPVKQATPFPDSPGWIGKMPDARSQGQLWGRFDSKQVLVIWADGHVKSEPIASLKGKGSTEAEVNRFWNGHG